MCYVRCAYIYDLIAERERERERTYSTLYKLADRCLGGPTDRTCRMCA